MDLMKEAMRDKMLEIPNLTEEMVDQQMSIAEKFMDPLVGSAFWIEDVLISAQEVESNVIGLLLDHRMLLEFHGLDAFKVNGLAVHFDDSVHCAVCFCVLRANEPGWSVMYLRSRNIIYR